MEVDLRPSFKIILIQSCIGFIIEKGKDINNNNNNIYKELISNKSAKSINQYRIHKIEEGTILKFEKFCYIETSKCEQEQQQQQQENISPSVVNDDTRRPSTTTSASDVSRNNDENFFTIKTIDSHKLNGSTVSSSSQSINSKKSLFSSILSNFLHSSASPGNLSVRSTIETSKQMNKSKDEMLNSSPANSRLNNSISSSMFKKSRSNTPTISDTDNNGTDETISERSKKATKKASRIIRVAKCYDYDTNSIVYIRETCAGEFMIDASTCTSSLTISTSNSVTPTASILQGSCLPTKYLYDLRTLVANNFNLLQLQSIFQQTTLELELIIKRNTKLNRLPFVRICINNINKLIPTPSSSVATTPTAAALTSAVSSPLIKHQLSVLVYDVNKNKFLEFFMSDLLKLNKYFKFTKSTNNMDLLTKYKAKLDWCMQVLNEYKYDIKLKLNCLDTTSSNASSYSDILSSFYLEQYLFRTYSRRNFRRRTMNSASLPLNNIINSNSIYANDDLNDDDSMQKEQKKQFDKVKNKTKSVTASDKRKLLFKNLTNLNGLSYTSKRPQLSNLDFNGDFVRKQDNISNSENDYVNGSMSNIVNENDKDSNQRKENRLKRIIKFATSSGTIGSTSKLNKTTQKQLSNLTLNEAASTTSLSEQPITTLSTSTSLINATAIANVKQTKFYDAPLLNKTKSESIDTVNKSLNKTSNYDSVRNKFASFFNSPTTATSTTALSTSSSMNNGTNNFVSTNSIASSSRTINENEEFKSISKSISAYPLTTNKQFSQSQQQPAIATSTRELSTSNKSDNQLNDSLRYRFSDQPPQQLLNQQYVTVININHSSAPTIQYDNETPINNSKLNQRIAVRSITSDYSSDDYYNITNNEDDTEEYEDMFEHIRDNQSNRINKKLFKKPLFLNQFKQDNEQISTSSNVNFSHQTQSNFKTNTALYASQPGGISNNSQNKEAIKKDSLQNLLNISIHRQNKPIALNNEFFNTHNFENCEVTAI